MAENSEFLSEQQRALERMREMSRRSSLEPYPHKTPPMPAFVKMQGGMADSKEKNQNSQIQDTDSVQPKGINQPENPQRGFNNRQQSAGGLLSGLTGGIKLPFLSGLKNDNDMTLILGLILILMSEKSDRMLLLALLYILM